MKHWKAWTAQTRSKATRSYVSTSSWSLVPGQKAKPPLRSRTNLSIDNLPHAALPEDTVLYRKSSFYIFSVIHANTDA